MRELLHTRENPVLDHHGRIESSPRMLIEVPPIISTYSGQLMKRDSSGVDADESLSILIDEGQQVCLLLGVHFELAPVKKSTASKSSKFLALHSNFFFC